MAYELLNPAACPAPARLFASAQAYGAGAIKTNVTNGTSHAR
jgi:hypothetical protein